MRWGNETVGCVRWKLSADQSRGARGLARPQQVLMSTWLNTAFLPGHKPLGRCMALHPGCDLWPNGDLSINYDISNSEAGCAVSLCSKGLEKCSASRSPESSLEVKIFFAWVCRRAVFSDFTDCFSKSFASESSPLAMDNLKTSWPPGAASFIPEIWTKSGSGQPCVADWFLPFISCSERRRGQCGEEDQKLRLVLRLMNWSWMIGKWLFC